MSGTVVAGTGVSGTGVGGTGVSVSCGTGVGRKGVGVADSCGTGVGRLGVFVGTGAFVGTGVFVGTGDFTGTFSVGNVHHLWLSFLGDALFIVFHAGRGLLSALSESVHVPVLQGAQGSEGWSRQSVSVIVELSSTENLNLRE